MDALRWFLTFVCWWAVATAGDPVPATTTGSSCPAIVKRAQWSAVRSTNVTYQVRPVAMVIVHHTATGPCPDAAACREAVRSIQEHHQTVQKWSDIGYNFLIAGGVVHEGIGWHRAGAHLRGYNGRAIGIAFVGNYDRAMPTAKELKALRKLLQCGVELGELDENYRLYGAKQLSGTASPGEHLQAELEANFEHYESQPVE